MVVCAGSVSGAAVGAFVNRRPVPASRSAVGISAAVSRSARSVSIVRSRVLGRSRGTAAREQGKGEGRRQKAKGKSKRKGKVRGVEVRRADRTAPVRMPTSAHLF